MGEKTNSNPKPSVFDKFDELNEKISQAKEEEQKWSVNVEHVQSGTMSDIEMRAVFDEFDEDKGGSIDAKELQRAMDSLGQTLTMQEVNDLILEIDANGDGEVDFDEFKVMATKGWFVNAFESKLVLSLQKSMAKYEDEDDDKNDDEESDEVLESPKDSSGDSVKIEALENEIKELKAENEKKQNEQIEKLQSEMKDLVEKNLEQMNGNEKQIKELTTENAELKKKLAATMQSEKASVDDEKFKEYEVKNDELIRENAELKKALESLQGNGKMSSNQAQNDEKNIDNVNEDPDVIVNVEPPPDNSVIYGLMRKVLEGLV